ncbi:MAG TPA: prepilin peptidase [Candidatus Paceibacterota bacterium]|nr:prepilin peptidase [Candidatus Paceibacterota bacterium]
MSWFILFVFGIAIGSFLNVVALRYDPDRFLFSTKRIGGRSHCPHCKKTLRWFELVPLASFAFQLGRCRRCRARLGVRYPIVEILSGSIFVFVPLRLGIIFPSILNPQFSSLAAIWIIVFELLLLMSLVDIQISIIPDEINIALLALGAIMLAAVPAANDLTGSYAVFFAAAPGALASHLFGALFALAFFGAIILITRGRGMGLGDFKLAVPLGLLFGLAGTLLFTAVGFIIGAAFGVAQIAAGRKHMKSALPFGPFLAIGAAIVFFGGLELMRFYIGLMAA